MMDSTSGAESQENVAADDTHMASVVNQQLDYEQKMEAMLREQSREIRRQEMREEIERLHKAGKQVTKRSNPAIA